MIDPWRITEERFDADLLAAHESVFAVSNGYLGVRGTPEEGSPVRDPGVVLNGLHETWPIVYPEDAYGLARTGQTIANATDGSIIRLFADDEPFDLGSSHVVRFERTLDMQGGVLRREVEWETARGRRVLIRWRRLASFEHRHLVAMIYEVVSLDGAVCLAVSSELVTHAEPQCTDDPRRAKGFADKVLVAQGGEADGSRALLSLRTRRSGLELSAGMDHAVTGSVPVQMDSVIDGDSARTTLLARLGAGDTLTLSKYVAYHWAPDPRPGDLAARTRRTLDRAAAAGYLTLEAGQRRHVRAFWERSDVEIEGAPGVQRTVRFNLFQLLQATARSE